MSELVSGAAAVLLRLGHHVSNQWRQSAFPPRTKEQACPERAQPGIAQEIERFRAEASRRPRLVVGAQNRTS
jgi:hypothetical protein